MTQNYSLCVALKEEIDSPENILFQKKNQSEQKKTIILAFGRPNRRSITNIVFGMSS